MFNCQQCGRTSRPRESAYTVAVETRVVKFPPREGVHKFRREGRLIVKDDPGGEGEQIVREVRVCGSCLNRYLNRT